MNTRERVKKALNHEQPDRTPLDLGATAQTGISASTLYKLRKVLGLEEKPVTVHEPFQLLGQVDEDVRKALGVDVVGLFNPVNFMGVRNENWRPWQMPDGTPVLMAGDFACGGGVDTQHTLPFDTPDEVEKQVQERLAIFAPGGGFVFNTIHNIVGNTPLENVMAMYEAVREFNQGG